MMAMNTIVNKSVHPSLVCFTHDNLNEEIDDNSELTCSCCGDDLSLEDDLGIKLTADPYYYHALNGSHPSRDENQGLLELRLQIARQEEKLDILSSKLHHCELENETLKAEKAVLVDERALAIQEDPITFSKGTNEDGDDGSVQLLIDTNAKLVTDNARLKVVVDVMRKSFQSYRKDSRRCRDKDKQAIKTLEQNNNNEKNTLNRSMSEHTAKTSLGWSSTAKSQEDPAIDSSRSTQDSMRKDSIQSGDEHEREIKSGVAGDCWNTEGEETQAAKHSSVGKTPARGKMIEFALSKGTEDIFASIDFGKNEIRRPKQKNEGFVQASKFVAEGSTIIKSDNLLVDFDENRKNHSLLKRWSKTLMR